MSLWGTIAGIAGSLIPGIGPVVGPLLGAGVNAFTGGSSSSNPSSAANNPTSSPQIQALMKSLGSEGGETNSATDEAQGFYKKVLGGDQESTRSLLGPDVDTVLSQYDNAAKAAVNLGPRGGGRTAILAEAPFKKAGVYGNILGQAKTTAAQGLTTIGGQKQAASTARRGQDVSELSVLTSGQESADRLAYEKETANNKAYGDLGSGIGSFLTNLIKNGGIKKSINAAPSSSGLSNLAYDGSDSGD